MAQRFVILRHDFPPDSSRASHWDLMLEAGGGLRTWAMQEIPQAGRRMELQPLAEHRLDYLAYEGPVSGGRGSVQRWDQGTYSVAAAGAANELHVTLAGQRLSGPFRIHQDDESRWWMEMVMS